MSDGGGDRGPSVVGDGGLAVAAGRSGERDAIGESEEGMLLLRGVMIASARPGRPLMAPEEVGDQPAADGGLSSLSLDRAREKGFRFVFDVVAAGNEVPLQLACPARRRSTADVSTHGVHRGRLTPGPHVPYMYMFETHLGCLRTKCFREYKLVSLEQVKLALRHLRLRVHRPFGFGVWTRMHANMRSTESMGGT